MSEHISLTEAAERLEVHYMTAYRYVRTGRLPAFKHGGQWAVSIDDLDSFETQGHRPAPRREIYPELIEARLLAADEAGACALLEDAMAAGATADEVYIDLLGAALRSVGMRWAAGEVSIADEHVATATAHRLISRLGQNMARRGRHRGTIVLATVADDHHTLPTALLRDLLRQRGFEVVDLGAHTPAESMVERALAADGLVGVGVCATRTGNDDAISEALAQLADNLTVPVVLGGAAIADEAHGHSLGPCIPAHSARHALELFDEIQGESSLSA
ncbi:MAG: cobalamin-dependent protein [Acidimicrobiales bacterium]